MTMTDSKTLKSISSISFSYDEFLFSSINGLPNIAALYKSINWANFNFASLGDEPVVRWDLIDFKKAQKSFTFSIELVDWSEINNSSSAAKIYKALNWANIDWNKLNSSVDLNWAFIDFKKVTKSPTFTIDKVDWTDINGATTASKIYKSIDWSKVDWNEVEQNTLTDINWALVDFKKAKAGDGFSVDKVEWSEVNSSPNAAKSYKEINWTAVDTTKIEDLDSQYLPKTSSSTPSSSGSFTGPSGIQIDANKLRSSLLASKETEGFSNDYDQDGFTSQSNTSKSIYQYLLNSAGQPLIVKETSNITFSQNSNSGSIKNTSEDIHFYYYSYGQQGFSLAKFRYEYDYGYEDANPNDPRSAILESITSYQAFGVRGIAYEQINFRRDLSLDGFAADGTAGFIDPPQELGGGGGVIRGYSLPAGAYSDPIAEYYLSQFFGEGIGDQTEINRTSDSTGKTLKITSKPGSLFQGTATYSQSDTTFEFNAKFLDFPIDNIDEGGWSSRGKLYSGGFDTFLQWRAKDEILFDDSSPFQYFLLGNYALDGTGWGRGDGNAAARTELFSNYSKDDQYPGNQTTVYKIDPLTGQYTSGEFSSKSEDILGIDQYSYSESERFTATYSQIDAPGMAWSYDPGLVASMNQQIDSALGRISPWPDEQPTIFSSYWPLV